MAKIKFSGGHAPSYLPAAELLPASWRIVRQNFITVFELVFIPMLLSTAAYMLLRTPAEIANLQAAAQDPNVQIHAGRGIVAGSLVSLVATVAIAPPLTYVLLRGVRHKKTDLWPAVGACRRYYLRYVVLLIVIVAAFLIGAILIIPAFFVLQRLVLAPFYLIDRDLSIKDALLTANREAAQSGWAVWQMLLIYGAIILLAYIPVFGTLASLIVGLAFCAAPAIRYKELTDAKLN